MENSIVENEKTTNIYLDKELFSGSDEESQVPLDLVKDSQVPLDLPKEARISPRNTEIHEINNSSLSSLNVNAKVFSPTLLEPNSTGGTIQSDVIEKIDEKKCEMCKTTNLIMVIPCKHSFCYTCLKGKFRSNSPGNIGSCKCPNCGIHLPRDFWERANKKDLESGSFITDYIEKCKKDGIEYVYMYSGKTSGRWWLYDYETNKSIYNKSTTRSNFSLNITARVYDINLVSMKQTSQENGNIRSINKIKITDYDPSKIKINGIAGVIA